MTPLSVDEICIKIKQTTLYNTNLYEVAQYMKKNGHLYEKYQYDFIEEMYIERFQEILKEGWEKLLKDLRNK